MSEATAERIETIEITGMAHGGQGVGRVDGQVCFVSKTVVGDVVRVRIDKVEKRMLWGTLVEVETASPDRAAQPVDSAAATWGHISYPGQAQWKQQGIKEAFKRIAGMTVDLEWDEDEDLRLGYRTRAEFRGDGENFGYHEPGTRTIVNTEHCPLCHPKLNAVLPALHEARVKGEVTVTVNPEGDDVLIWTKRPYRRLKHRFPTANSSEDGGRRTKFILDDVPVVNGTFSQSSLLLNRRLVSVAHQYIGGAVSLLDLYCGNGNMSIGLPQKCRVVGVDHSKDAVKAARSASEREYRTGNENKMKRLIKQDEWDTILLDPPRTGAKGLMSFLAPCQARAIVYVSCDPATLARDVKSLSAEGWKVKHATAIDMFPNTHHVETVCRLER